MTVWLYVSLRKGTSEIGVKLVFFTFLLTFFVETLIKSINYCQSVPLDHLYVYCENCMWGFLPSFLTWVNLAIFCLDQCQMEIFSSAQHQLGGWGFRIARGIQEIACRISRS